MFLGYMIGYTVTRLVFWTIGLAFMAISLLYQFLVWLFCGTRGYREYADALATAPDAGDDDDHGGWAKDRPRRPNPGPPRFGIEQKPTPARPRDNGGNRFDNIKLNTPEPVTPGKVQAR